MANILQIISSVSMLIFVIIATVVLFKLVQVVGKLNKKLGKKERK